MSKNQGEETVSSPSRNKSPINQTKVMDHTNISEDGSLPIPPKKKEQIRKSKNNGTILILRSELLDDMNLDETE